MSTLVIDARRLRPAVLTPPVSKSDALRALTLAGILEMPPPDVGEEPPDDVRRLERGLRALRERHPVVDCGDGAGPFRVLLGQAAVRSGTATFEGSQRLAERPHAALVEALERTLGEGGLRIQTGRPWPWIVRGAGPVRRPAFRVRAAESGQFATSLLLAAAALAHGERRAWSVESAGPVASRGYVDLTLRWLRRAGFVADVRGDSVCVQAGARVAAFPTLPRDWSSGAYLLLAAWRGGGQVVGLDPEEPQPDRAVLRILGEIGLAVSREAGGLGVTGTPSEGVRASAAECPDLLPTLAALACVLPRPSVFTEVGILRGKESDRLEGIVDLVRAGGASASLEGDTLRVTPGRRPEGRLAVACRGDHRLAMSASVLAACHGTEVAIDGPECVGKSFPGFFKELSLAGAVLC